MKTAITLGLTSLLLTNIYTKTVDESTTGALLSFPSVIDGPLYNKTYDVAPAQFGYQKYGGMLEGVLILPSNTTYHKECPKTNITPEGPEPLGTNPYIHYITDWFISDNDIKDYILVIDRKDCYFVDKIEHAQEMGAKGVIICDWKFENLFTMWIPEDWRDDIDIPSVLLQKSHCQDLYAHLGVKNWDPENIQFTTYPSPETINWTIATIEWGLPHPDDKVEYELWTSSNDYLGSRFKHNFNTTAIELDKAQDTQFTPHMYILNGSHWGCDAMFNGSYTLPCKQQCTNTGRYCAVDPEYDMAIGLDGMDVIQENLRSLCVWEYDKKHFQESFGTDDVMWWYYSVLWDENCGVYSNTSNNFHANCSFAQMDKLTRDGALSASVKQCIIDSGGYGYEDGENSILKTETKLKYNSSIYAVPMVRVNEFLIHGNIDCEPPVTTSSCEVLAAICAGFIEGEPKPDVCYVTPAPTMLTCNDTEKDCNGTCFGNYLIDACNQCLPVSSHEWNACIGCNGIVNGIYDCAGTCGGHYAVNVCGYCKDTRHIGWDSFGVDCEGGCSTVKIQDQCGHCIEESNPEWDDCIDCDGVPFGGKEKNACEFCLDPYRNDFEDYGKDCRGVCEGGWTLDKCDQCLSTSNITRDSCIGCDGVPYSNKAYNECGRCILKSDPNFNEYGKDCRDLCALYVDDTYYVDECGQCLLPTDSEWGNCCGGDINKGINECRLCIFKNSTDFNQRGKDCNGICFGQHVIDGCGICLLSTDPAFDECMKCGNNNNMTYDCMDICGGNHAINPCGRCIDAELTNFETFGQDCSGECGGNHEIDSCGHCLLTTNITWNDCVGCDGVANSGKINNECGRCVSVTDSNFNEYGRDCTGNCAQTAADTHYIDECGQCLLPGDESWNSCIIINNNTNSNGEGQVTDNGGEGGVNMMIIWIIIIAVCALLLICLAFIVIVYLYKKVNEMKRQFDEIKQNYQPMDDMGTTSSLQRTKGNRNNKTNTKGMTSVPDQEESD